MSIEALPSENVLAVMAPMVRKKMGSGQNTHPRPQKQRWERTRSYGERRKVLRQDER